MLSERQERKEGARIFMNTVNMLHTVESDLNNHSFLSSNGKEAQIYRVRANIYMQCATSEVNYNQLREYAFEWEYER